VGSAGLQKLCGAGGCQLTAVTTKFVQAGKPTKGSCQLPLTVPFTGAQGKACKVALLSASCVRGG
jgi:hypothetical protein